MSSAIRVGRVDAEVLDSFYGRLRACRDDCRGAKHLVDHRTALEHHCRVVKHRRRSEHDCGELGCRFIECPPHTCKPLAAATIRQIHWILASATIALRKSRGQISAKQWEKDTKTHQQRRLALDAETVTVLEEHLARCRAHAESIGVALEPDAFVFPWRRTARHTSHPIP